MLFLQTTPPDTNNYFILGYAVIFTVLGIYLASLAIRNRNAKKEIEMLEELEGTEPVQQVQKEVAR